MQISTEKIKTLNPCVDRFNNYLKHYADFKGSVADFAMLENITYQDKIWVLVRLMTHVQKMQFAVKCAFSVLDIYEAKYTDDKPRKALEAAEKWINEPNQENADAAVYTATAAYAAADAAYAAAAYAATVTSYAAYAATAAADAVTVATKDNASYNKMMLKILNL